MQHTRDVRQYRAAATHRVTLLLRGCSFYGQAIPRCQPELHTFYLARLHYLSISPPQTLTYRTTCVVVRIHLRHALLRRILYFENAPGLLRMVSQRTYTCAVCRF